MSLKSYLLQCATAAWLMGCVWSAGAADGYQSLFNGRNLDGWEGDPQLWSVEDGAITGRTSEKEPLPYNKFLVWTGGTLRNFELKVQVRLTGNNNSGIQYRSQRKPDVGPGSVGGYQADIHPTAENNGMLYDERGRGIVARNGQSVIIDTAGAKWLAEKLGEPVKVDLTEWNEYTVIAKGNVLVHQINGKTTTRIVDLQESERELEGILAFQVHRGPSMKVQFKDIRLKVLPEGGVLSPAEAPVPSEAQLLSSPKPKAAPKKPAPTKKPQAKAPTAQVARPRNGQASRTGNASAESVQPDATPQWIWASTTGSNQTIYLRREMVLQPGRHTSARLYATCDNSMEIFINGKQVMSSGSWDRPVVKDVLDHLQKGKNVLVVKAGNADGPAGFLCRLVLEAPDRGNYAYVSDAQWKVANQPAEGMHRPGFGETEWKPAHVLAALGEAPWTSVNEKTLASIITLKEPGATPVDQLQFPEGFQVELLHSVSADDQGSWVSMTTDPKGRLIVSDQYGGLFRVTVPAKGKGSQGVQVEKINVPLGEAQGLLWAFDSLYVMVNKGGKYASGLYRVRDTDGDDHLDQVEMLKELNGGGEHGPHAVLLTPDGKGLYVVCGNQTKLPEVQDSRVPRVWDEDLLLPRVYGRGFMRGVPAPGGFVAKVDPDGKNWELITVGFRNQYDAALNRHGDLFTYDADMEWDMNTPWYRPTRVCQVLSGADYGWRNGSGKWPTHYPDTLAPVVDIGPGSPTGVTFGYGAAFPARYQEAFYICDWSYGKLYAVHLTPAGAGYSATFEEFISGIPLPLTDILIHPGDGAMYFTIGGRRTKSGLYRVIYNGKESTQPSRGTTTGASDRAKRRRLESMQRPVGVEAVNEAWASLGSWDRVLRYSARVVLEHQDPALWQEKALSEKQPQASLTALIALSRTGDASLQARVVQRLTSMSPKDLDENLQIEWVRAISLAFMRLGAPSEPQRKAVLSQWDNVFPTQNRYLNGDLCQLLVYLNSSELASKAVPHMRSAPSQEEQIDLAKSLRLLKAGWTPALRKDYFEWFLVAAGYRGGASFSKFVESIKNEAVKELTDAEQLALKPVLEAQPKVQSPLDALMALGGRSFVKEWTVEELSTSVQAPLKGRNFEQGRKMFGAAACYSCHRFAGEGGSVGPDLTGVAGRFSPRDLLESIVHPSKEVSDQYAPVVITLSNGQTVTGRIVNLSGDSVKVNTNMFDPDEQASVDRKMVVSMEPSKVSMMPEGLLNMLSRDEILDLTAFLLSGGNRQHAAFAR